jgi:hypothetical protein
MSAGNFEARVSRAFNHATGPLIGEKLLAEFKNEIIKEKIFQIMFDEDGSRIFIDKMPNWNETILPAIAMSWKSETFNSFDTYFEGSIDAMIALPVKLEGDYNSIRRVGSLFQRFMGGSMNLFDKIPGLTMFGYGSDYNYEGLAKFDGFQVPCIQIRIPFKFDLQRLQLDVPEFDPFAPIDESDVGWIEEHVVAIINEQGNEFNSTETKITTGEVNV